jgi:hypothetical protein
VQFVDAGGLIQLISGDDILSLRPLVTENGPVYTSEELPGRALSGTGYTIATSGSEALEAFRVTDAVRLPAELALQGASGRVPLPAAGDLALRWTAGDDETAISVSLIPTGNSGKAVYCQCEDKGQLTVPADILGQMGSGDAVLMMTRTRVHYFPQPDGVAAMATAVRTVILPAVR